MKQFVLYAVLAGLIGCSANAEQQHASTTDSVDAPEGTRVEVALITPTEAHITLNLTGEIEGSRDANLASSLGGYVESVRVHDGESVRHGKVLVSVDQRLHQASLQQADAQSEMARVEYERLVKMGDGVSESVVFQAKMQARIAAAQAVAASVRASRASIVAPFDGVVTMVSVEQGEVTGPGSPVVRLVQLDPVHVKVSVADRDVVALREGLPVKVTANARSSVYAGTVRSISPAGDSKTRSFNVEIAVPNPEHELLPGMVTRVQVERSLGEAFVVPQDWLLSKANGQGVFLERDGKAEWRTVELGEVLHNRVVVRSGLQLNDRIITVGHRELLAGDALLVSRQGVCCTDGRVVYGRSEGAEQ
jgi:membrane fusion protein (multidrug efflux system)